MNRAVVLLLIVSAFVCFHSMPASSQTRQVVLLYDERTDLPGLSMLDAGFVRTLTSESPQPVEIYREAMDLSRFDSETYVPRLRDYLAAKYAGKKIDVAVAVMGPALDFLIKYGANTLLKYLRKPSGALLARMGQLWS